MRRTFGLSSLYFVFGSLLYLSFPSHTHADCNVNYPVSACGAGFSFSCTHDGAYYCCSQSADECLNTTATSTPIPTPRRPRSVTPTWGPVMSSLVPCSKTRTPEFAPLRPYPANACDPLIPRKLPEAPKVIPNKLFLTFQCGESANPQGTVNVSNVVDISQLNYLPTPWSSISLNGSGRSVNYLCDASSSDICFVQEVHVSVALNYQDSQFPILGNTQNFLSDPAKVNQYLSWYLEGTVQQSEQKLLDPNNPNDINRLINYSGPVKKLLSRVSQTGIHFTMENSGLLNIDYHNYIVNPPNQRLGSFYSTTEPNTPLSSLEDVTGEVTVGLEPNRQPVSPEIDGQIFSIGLSVGAADSRLYFPHLKETNVLSQLLASTFKPNPTNIPHPTPPLTDPNPVDTYNDSFLSQRIGLHQGIGPAPAAINSNSLGLAGDIPVQFTPLVNNYVVRNTEVIENSAPPKPLYSAPSVKCNLSPVRTNQGDDLVGSTVNTYLIYRQLFRYTPTLLIGNPCPPNLANCTSRPCVDEGQTCYYGSYSNHCCFGTCSYPAGGGCRSSGVNDLTTCGGINCSSLDQTTCTSAFPYTYCCTYDLPTSQCPSWPTRDLNSKAYISVFTKTPLVERLYENLVSGPQSVLKRFLPSQVDNSSTSSGYQALNPDSAVPAGTSANYTVLSSNLQNPSVNSGMLYFPRVGGILDHILGSGSQYSDQNLQCLLWPKGYCEHAMSCNDFENLLTETGTGECGICNAPVGPLAQKILAQAGKTYNIPAADIYAAMLHEGGSWPEYHNFANDDEVRQWSLSAACGGIPMPKCDNSIEATQPPFGFIKTYFYQGTGFYAFWNAVTKFLPDRNSPDTISRCNFIDAAFAAAKALSLSSARTDTTKCIPSATCGGYTFSTNNIPDSCTSWTDTKIAQSQVYYGGQCYDLKICDNVPYNTQDVVNWYHQYKCN